MMSSNFLQAKVPLKTFESWLTSSHEGQEVVSNISKV